MILLSTAGSSNSDPMENLYIFNVLLALSFCSSNEIADYENLIIQELERAKDFSLPNDSKGSEPTTGIHIEYGIFDHIVIGAGSAGAVVSSRLSEDDYRDVLLLEAGGCETNFTEIPGMAPQLLLMEYNWNYHTTPQTTSCLGMNEKRCIYPRGKLLGGSSGINAMIYTRGNKMDYNNWCAEGNPGWCYNDVLPFFKKSENSQINGDRGYHGHGGYLNVEYAEPLNEKYWSFINAHQELERPLVDYNGKRQEGVGITQFTLKRGRRHSTWKAFLEPVLSRTNLKILTGSHVTRILVNSNTKKAFGVVFARNNRYYVARSRKDIILSAGTIGSPQILMLSGIGPEVHLQRVGIPLIQNLNVGKNLQDHLVYGAVHFDTNITIPFKSLRENIIDYLNGVGDFTDGYQGRALSFLRTNLTKPEDSSDIEHITFLSPSDYKVYRSFFNYDNISYEHGWGTVDYTKSIAVYVLLLHPKSVGQIQLKSKDPFEYPLIDTNFLSDPLSEDIETMYQGIQLVLQLLETKALKKINARLHKVHLPGCSHLEYLSKSYWYCHIRHIAGNLAHPIGTCKMGPNPVRGDVVDHKLRVYGIDNLRVADASVIPSHLSAHTNAPTMMIGEKAAHMIRFE